MQPNESSATQDHMNNIFIGSSFFKFNEKWIYLKILLFYFSVLSILEMHDMMFNLIKYLFNLSFLLLLSL